MPEQKIARTEFMASSTAARGLLLTYFEFEIVFFLLDLIYFFFLGDRLSEATLTIVFSVFTRAD